MTFPLTRLVQQARRYYRNRGIWRYDSFGQCTSCGQVALFVDDRERREGMAALTARWDLSEGFKTALTERENWFCVNCYANFRTRACAGTILRLLALNDVGELVRRMRKDDSFRFYETAAYNVFRTRVLRQLPGYVVSEYFDDVPTGTWRNGTRCENLERLTFPDRHFDVVVNSDVLEHVHDLDRALSEVRRVLKPGGFHVFTVPVDKEILQTRDRVRFLDGKPHEVLPPILHGDTIRAGGSPVIRDFGRDTLEFLGRGGMECLEEQSVRGGLHITSVFYARKNA